MAGHGLPDDEDDIVGHHDKMSKKHQKLSEKPSAEQRRSAHFVDNHAIAADAHGLAAALHEAGEDAISSDHAENATRIANYLSDRLGVTASEPKEDESIRGNIKKAVDDVSSAPGKGQYGTVRNSKGNKVRVYIPHKDEDS